MDEKDIVVGLDIGATKVCTVIGVQAPQKPLEIIGIGTHLGHGLKRGHVVNIDKTVRSIKASLEEATLMAGVNIRKATIGVAGSQIHSFNSSGVVPIKGSEITREDVSRVVEAAKAVVVPNNREILHIIPREFKVDANREIKDPVGMCGVRLEAHVHIVTSPTPLVQNLVKCVEQAGVEVESVMLRPLASSEAIISPEEKELGVVLVDIGGGTTDLVIWKDGSVIHSQIIPVGGAHFTNDLAVALKIPHAEAEKIKISHGTVLAGKEIQEEDIMVQAAGASGIVGAPQLRKVSSHTVASVLGARASELLGIIKGIVEGLGLEEKLMAGHVFTGGGALIGGFSQLAEYTLMKTCKIGYPMNLGGMTNIMQNPKFATVLGLLLQAVNRRPKYGHGRTRTRTKRSEVTQADLIGRLGHSIKAVFREIF